MGLDAPFPGPVLDALACPPYSGPPGALRPAATRSHGAAERAPASSPAAPRVPALRAYTCARCPRPAARGTGLRPPTQNRHLGVPGHTVPRWTRGPIVCPFDRRPPASSRFVLDARSVQRGSAGSAAPPAAPRSYGDVWWLRLPPSALGRLPSPETPVWFLGSPLPHRYHRFARLAVFRAPYGGALLLLFLSEFCCQ